VEVVQADRIRCRPFNASHDILETTLTVPQQPTEKLQSTQKSLLQRRHRTSKVFDYDSSSDDELTIPPPKASMKKVPLRHQQTDMTSGSNSDSEWKMPPPLKKPQRQQRTDPASGSTSDSEWKMSPPVKMPQRQHTGLTSGSSSDSDAKYSSANKKLPVRRIRRPARYRL